MEVWEGGRYYCVCVCMTLTIFILKTMPLLSSKAKHYYVLLRTRNFGRIGSLIWTAQDPKIRFLHEQREPDCTSVLRLCSILCYIHHIALRKVARNPTMCLRYYWPQGRVESVFDLCIFSFFSTPSSTRWASFVGALVIRICVYYTYVLYVRERRMEGRKEGRKESNAIWRCINYDGEGKRKLPLMPDGIEERGKVCCCCCVSQWYLSTKKVFFF